MTNHWFLKESAYKLEIVAHDQAVDLARLSGLTAESFLNSVFPREIPYGDAEGRIMGEFVGVLLTGISAGEVVDPFS